MVLDSLSYGFDSDFPPIDGPRAPLADVLEIEDYCIDGSCYVLSEHDQKKLSETKVASGELNVDDDEDSDISNMSDIEMDDEDVTDIEKDEDEDDVEIDDDDDEGEDYPELSKGKKGEALPLAEDSYDFSVMDTEKDTRKRKTKGKGTVDKKKKTKKA